MPRRFCSSCNAANNLVISTPVAEANDQGLFILSDVFDGSEFSLGFRFYVTTLTPSTQHLLQNTDSTTPKNIWWEIYVLNDSKLKFGTSIDGAIELYSGITTNTLYSVWIDAYEEDLYWYIYNWSTGLTVSDTTGRGITSASDSFLTLLNDYNNSSYLHGSLFDFAYVPGSYNGSSLYLKGGLNYYFFHGFWPMREGSGSYCNQLIQKGPSAPWPSLGSGGIFTGGFSWAPLLDITQDNARKWS